MTALAPLIIKRRRTFGLDHARHPDPAQVTDAVLTRLTEALPEVVPLRLATTSVEPESHALLLLPPDGPIAVLRIASRCRPSSHAARRLDAACRRLRIPCVSMSRLEELRPALRRCGIELEG